MTETKYSFMDRFQEVMEAKVLPIANKIAAQRHIGALRDGMTILIPLTIIGGLFMLMAIPPVPPDLEPTNFIFRFLLGWQNWANSNIAVLLIPYTLTIGIISVYVTCSVSYRLASTYGMDAISSIATALLTFLTVAAFPANDGVFSTAQFGAPAMFTAILIGLLTVEITHLFYEKNWFIRLPAQVPPNVAASINILFPMIANVLIFLVLNQICFAMTGQVLTRLVAIIMQPLLGAATSLPSILFLNFLASTFWFFGIHGPNIISFVVSPITAQALADNAAAYAAGEPMPWIFAGAINNVFGNWITWTAVLIIMLFFSKAPQTKALGKVALIPTLFNINEPIIFGYPLVMNILMYIPLVLCGIVNFTTVYILTKIGFLGRFFITLPFTIPGWLQAFLATMDWKTSVLWLLLVVVDLFICMPFLRAYDKQLIAENEANEHGED